MDENKLWECLERYEDLQEELAIAKDILVNHSEELQRELEEEAEYIKEANNDRQIRQAESYEHVES